MGCQLTSTLYTVARAKSGLLSLPDILRRLRVLGLILSAMMGTSDSRALAAFSETDLEDTRTGHSKPMLVLVVICTDLLNAGTALSFLSEERSGTERARE